MAVLLPSMSADIVFHHGPSRRIVFDTKFANIVTSRQHGGVGLKNGHLYQLYAYLRSQTGASDTAADGAEGVLLYLALDHNVDETAVIQGHSFRFVTVDLAAPSAKLRSDTLDVVKPKMLG